MAHPFATLDATAQAALVREGQVSPRDLVEAAIARIERLNPVLNAVITPLFEVARDRVATRDVPASPFHGVPLLLKDYLCHSAGEPYYEGTRFLRDRDWRAGHDTHLATRFRAAGFVTVGRTNLPELAGAADTDSAAFGPARNPWDLTRTPGGSSGGSAAAVAAGLTPVAHGNDGTGSLRIPASCCGLVGLKPSRGRVPFGPARAPGLLGNIAEFVLTRPVRDAAAILDAVAGPMPGELFDAPPPARPYRDEIGCPPGQLRVGLLMRDVFLDQPIGAEPLAAVQATGRLLESLGHAVEESFPPALTGPTGLGLALRIIATSGLAARLDAWADQLGQPIGSDDVEPATWARAEEGRAYTAVQVHAAVQRLVAGVGRAPAWWAAGFDLLVTPTMIQLPPLIAGFDRAQTGAVFGLFTMPFSITGQPAISLPLHWSATGLPVGVQVVAAYGREDVLLRVASQLEAAAPWAHRRPPLHA